MNDEVVKAKNNSSEVVIILPYSEDKVLMQLRDQKQEIAFPGHWGFFGGSIDTGEKPKETAWRELEEELGFRPKALNFLETGAITELGDLISHIYFCELTASVSQLELKEGMDLGLFTLDEVKMKELYSGRNKKLFPVVPLDYVGNTINKVWKSINRNIEQ